MDCAHMKLKVALVHAIHEPCPRHRRPKRTRDLRKRVEEAGVDDPSNPIEDGSREDDNQPCSPAESKTEA